MRTIIIFLICLSILSCKPRTDNKAVGPNIQLLIPDTTNNQRAQQDLSAHEYYLKVAKQIGLRDMTKGVDSIEVRIWYSFSFSKSEELYILNLVDTNLIVSYFRFYPRPYDYDNSNTRNWNPYTQPIIDSSFSKSMILKKEYYDSLKLTNIWSLRSQSELNIPDSIGFNDCSTHAIEIADRKRYKFLLHHCPNSYYSITKRNEILEFIEYNGRVVSLLRTFGLK